VKDNIIDNLCTIVAAKLLTKSETYPSVGELYLFNDYNELEKLFCVTDSPKCFRAAFISFCNDEVAPINSECTLTWFSFKEGEQSLSECSLRIKDNQIKELGKSSDLFFIGRKTDDSIIILVAGLDSKISSLLQKQYSLSNLVSSEFVFSCNISNNTKESDSEISEETSKCKISWDARQKKVIESPKSARLIVDAGPGTGKTAVACARVAWLIDNTQIQPERIWMVSFTRAAVYEVRNRIRSYLSNPDDAFSITIATLDSKSWSMHSGFNENAKMTGTYDQTIENLIEDIKSNPYVGSFLQQQIEHLIIDETQDIVGSRAVLLLKIIQRLSVECGITIFNDSSQAIYGFSVDEDNSIQCGVKQPPLIDQIKLMPDLTFSDYALTNIYRTGCHNLKELFSKTRQKIIHSSDNPINSQKSVIDDINELCNMCIGTFDDIYLDNIDDAFVLFRRRVEVLRASNRMEGMQHRIRMSGLPCCVEPWVGACLSEHKQGILTRSEFESLWHDKAIDTTPSLTFDVAWQMLVVLAGKSEKVVDMKILRYRLGASRPPAEFCTADVGTGGPILSTIHASKGREADVVCLMLPQISSANNDASEETRVAFVGATRARKSLSVGKGYISKTYYTKNSRRAYTLWGSNRRLSAFVEIGRDGDITAEGVAGKKYFSTTDDVQQSQNRLKKIAYDNTGIYGVRDPSAGYAYRIDECRSGSRYIAALSQKVNADLFEIRNKHFHFLKLPAGLSKLHVIAIRTIVLPPDHHELMLLHNPWSQSGIMLAPVVIGMPLIKYSR